MGRHDSPSSTDSTPPRKKLKSRKDKPDKEKDENEEEECCLCAGNAITQLYVMAFTFFFLGAVGGITSAALGSQRCCGSAWSNEDHVSLACSAVYRSCYDVTRAALGVGISSASIVMIGFIILGLACHCQHQKRQDKKSDRKMDQKKSDQKREDKREQRKQERDFELAALEMQSQVGAPQVAYSEMPPQMGGPMGGPYEAMPRMSAVPGPIPGPHGPIHLPPHPSSYHVAHHDHYAFGPGPHHPPHHPGGHHPHPAGPHGPHAGPPHGVPLSHPPASAPPPRSPTRYTTVQTVRSPGPGPILSPRSVPPVMPSHTSPRHTSVSPHRVVTHHSYHSGPGGPVSARGRSVVPSAGGPQPVVHGAPPMSSYSYRVAA